VRGEGCGQRRRRLCRKRCGQSQIGDGDQEGKGGMAVTAMMAIIGMRRRFAIDLVRCVVIAIMIMAVCGRDIEMLLQGMLHRPDSLEGDKPHEENQKNTAHGGE
jgi:hypothetical protein